MNMLQNEEKCSCGCGHDHHDHHQVNDCHKAEARPSGKKGVRRMAVKRVCACCEDDDEGTADKKKRVTMPPVRHAVAGLLVKRPCACEGDDCSEEEAAHGGHAHTQNDDGHVESSRLRLVLLVAGAALFAAAIFVPEGHMLRLPVFVIAYILLGFDVIGTAAQNIRHGEIFDENLLMSVSTIGAFCIGEFPEAVAVMLFYQIGERLQAMAAGKSRRSIRALMDIKAESANLVTERGVQSVAPETVKPGQCLLVKPGERFPLDGVITEGVTQADTSPLTGEHVPRVLGAGDEVLSGAINLTGAVQVRVTSEYRHSTAAKIMDMVETAAARKAPVERFIKKFARVYTPVVVCAAALLAIVPPLVMQDGSWADWIRRALVFLVVSCPCALVVSVPLTMFSGIGAASRKGILVKGGNCLQALSEVDTAVFDKTGTLTKGVFAVTQICPTSGVSEAELLETACMAERLSNHPIAKSICAAYAARGGDAENLAHCEMFQEQGGLGITAQAGAASILCGNDRLMRANGLAGAAYGGLGSVVHVAKDKMYYGYIVISDVMREGAEQLAASLQGLGVSRIVMLTGDRRENAERFAWAMGIKEVRAELLPDGKVDEMERLYSERKQCKIAFVGDGINDAPVLTRADVGIAMGGVGSEAAVEAADVVLMADEPLKVAEAIRTAKNTMRIARQNVAFSLIVKFGVLLLAAAGFASMWLAVFADVGVTLLAVLNAVRRK